MAWTGRARACTAASIALLALGCGRTGVLDVPGPTFDAGFEATTADAADDVTEEAPPDSGSVERVADEDPMIQGVTDDGMIIYMSMMPSSTEIWAVPFTGGAAPTKISPPGFSAPGVHGSAVASIWHHVVLMSMSIGNSSATPGVPVSTWDERTGKTTIFTAPPGTYGVANWAVVSPDSKYVAMPWTPPSGSNVPWSASRVDGTDSVTFDHVFTAAFDQDRLVYTTFLGQYAGSPGGLLISLNGDDGWSSVTLSTSACGYRVDATGTRALFANGPYPGGRGVFLAPLDGGAPTMIDPTGGGPLLYLSPDGTFAMYTAAAGTTNAHVAAVRLPVSGPPGTPYPVYAGALSAGTITLNDVAEGGPIPSVFPDAPTGPVAFFAVSPPTMPFSSLALVGVGAGATAPDLSLPFFFVNGLTSDQSRALLGRPGAPSVSQDPGNLGALSVFQLPDGPESAPLSTSSFGWIGLRGSTVLFTDSWVNGTSDLRIADVAKGTSSTLVASDVTSYAVSPDHTRLAYTSLDGGLWVTALPTGI